MRSQPHASRACAAASRRKACARSPTASSALTPHPAALGSALTHPHITTDFSESQLELDHRRARERRSGAATSSRGCTSSPTACSTALGDERLWVSSMPCGLPTDETIPIGRYGSSNVGRAKSVYRMGLSHRYGRRMQTISGIHYNWSLPERDRANSTSR